MQHVTSELAHLEKAADALSNRLGAVEAMVGGFAKLDHWVATYAKSTADMAESQNRLTGAMRDAVAQINRVLPLIGELRTQLSSQQNRMERLEECVAQLMREVELLNPPKQKSA